MSLYDKGKSYFDGHILYGLLDGRVLAVSIPLYVSIGNKKIRVAYPFTVTNHSVDEASGTIDIGNGVLRRLVVRPIGGPNLPTCYFYYEVSEIPEEVNAVHAMD